MDIKHDVLNRIDAEEKLSCIAKTLNLARSNLERKDDKQEEIIKCSRSYFP